MGTREDLIAQVDAYTANRQVDRAQELAVALAQLGVVDEALASRHVTALRVMKGPGEAVEAARLAVQLARQLVAGLLASLRTRPGSDQLLDLGHELRADLNGRFVGPARATEITCRRARDLATDSTWHSVDELSGDLSLRAAAAYGYTALATTPFNAIASNAALSSLSATAISHVFEPLLEDIDQYVDDPDPTEAAELARRLTDLARRFRPDLPLDLPQLGPESLQPDSRARFSLRAAALNLTNVLEPASSPTGNARTLDAQLVHQSILDFRIGLRGHYPGGKPGLIAHARQLATHPAWNDVPEPGDPRTTVGMLLYGCVALWAVPIFDEEAVDRGPEPGDKALSEPLRVFLCHSSGDKSAVRSLADQLEAAGCDVWLDERKLLPGQDWDSEIRRAVRQSDVVVVVLSENSVTKIGYVQRETTLALDAADERPEGSIYIVPLALDTVELPDRLRKWHALRTEQTDWFDRLVQSLRLRAEEQRRSLPFAND